MTFAREEQLKINRGNEIEEPLAVHVPVGERNRIHACCTQLASGEESLEKKKSKLYHTRSE